jgi:hypothetical protein
MLHSVESYPSCEKCHLSPSKDFGYSLKPKCLGDVAMRINQATIPDDECQALSLRAWEDRSMNRSIKQSQWRK